MESGYKIFWTPNALKELEQNINYLQHNFTDKEIRKLAHKIESSIENYISKSFYIPVSEKDVHKAIILQFNTMYYRVNDSSVEILSFFSNRQSPQKRKI
ncbi:type II toxin-antitoxin system RelE/ParE family toxin [Chryseobacterium salviniae]|uniref:Type II toxin-antitoxin system RelE/ParE family toxin n=1 Tax=Chryseobacterium salviniae TaxID=3101750 RepID=A0ABU6HX50_9FLAO|nr:type II toxin-antitoxin system RelE/ParE family toxin [Chryseobacterium sp. T9W2-O]MEC3877408.1 type II toxin-antitoxin system RelE/ParE family toxin [Chryseobacterium sp. T9W2-O]